MKIKSIKTIWVVVSMLLLACPANAKLSESQMCQKITNFYKEYIRLSASTNSDSEKKRIELIRNNCTSSFASTIEDDAKEGMGLDYICCEYADNIDLSQSLDVIKDDKYYIVFFYANCLQRNGKKSKLRIQLRITVVNDLISDVEDPFPAQRFSDSNAKATASTRKLNGTWQCCINYGNGLSYQYEYKNNGEEIRRGTDGSTFTYQYYLSNIIPTTFDFSKVGTYTEGCYLIEYNPSQKKFSCYSIAAFGVMDWKDPLTGKLLYDDIRMNLRLVTEDLKDSYIHFAQLSSGFGNSSENRSSGERSYSGKIGTGGGRR